MPRRAGKGKIVPIGLIVDWAKGLPVDVLACIADGSDDRAGMRGACKTWAEGFDLSITTVSIKSESKQGLADADLAFLEGKHITNLDLSGCPLIGDAGLSRLRGLPLVKLDLEGCTKVIDICHLFAISNFSDTMQGSKQGQGSEMGIYGRNHCWGLTRIRERV